MVWYKDPLEYFHDEKSPSHGFDVYFQVSPLLPAASMVVFRIVTKVFNSCTCLLLTIGRMTVREAFSMPHFQQIRYVD